MYLYKEASMSTVSLQGRSILDLESLSPAEIHRILDVAGQMKKVLLSGNKKKDYFFTIASVPITQIANSNGRSYGRLCPPG